MKLSIENLPGETVDVPAGRAGVWKGTTEEGFRCLLLVQEIVRPEGSPDEDFAELGTVAVVNGYAGISQAEEARLVKIAFPDGGSTEPPPPKVVDELEAIAHDKTADATLRVEAIDLIDLLVETACIAASGGSAPSTQEFWRRVAELRRKRDERPPR